MFEAVLVSLAILLFGTPFVVVPLVIALYCYHRFFPTKVVVEGDHDAIEALSEEDAEDDDTVTHAPITRPPAAPWVDREGNDRRVVVPDPDADGGRRRGLRLIRTK